MGTVGGIFIIILIILAVSFLTNYKDERTNHTMKNVYRRHSQIIHIFQNKYQNLKISKSSELDGNIILTDNKSKLTILDKHDFYSIEFITQDKHLGQIILYWEFLTFMKQEYVLTKIFSDLNLKKSDYINPTTIRNVYNKSLDSLKNISGYNGLQQLIPGTLAGHIKFFPLNKNFKFEVLIIPIPEHVELIIKVKNLSTNSESMLEKYTMQYDSYDINIINFKDLIDRHLKLNY